MYANRRRATPPHERSMDSYSQFAWSDAASLARWIADEFGAGHARKMFERLSKEQIVHFEGENEDRLTEFIKRTEGQRPAFLKRVTKELKLNEHGRIVFMVLALIGLLRARKVLEIRDHFRDVLAPGQSNRITASEMYAFAARVQATFRYDWPQGVFDAIGAASDDDAGEDEDADGA